MALARVHTWSAGEVLLASDLNAEFNNVLTNANSLISPFTANVAGGGFQLNNIVIGASNPLAGSFTTLSYTGALTTTAAAHICEGRMTLTTAVPVTTSDVTAATTVYFTPYKGNRIALYDGSASWVTLTFTELSVAVPATTSTMYDLWAYNNSGTVALEALAWTSDTARATALAVQNGVYVKTGATTRRYLGSFRTTTSSGQTEDSVANRFVWNYYNRVMRSMKVVESTASWTYSTASYQQANAANTNQLNFIVGVAEDIITARVQSAEAVTSGATVRSVGVGIGADSGTVNSALTMARGLTTTTTPAYPTAEWEGYFAVGRHYLAWLEFGGGTDTQTWIGATAPGQSGIVGAIWA